MTRLLTRIFTDVYKSRQDDRAAASGGTESPGHYQCLDNSQFAYAHGFLVSRVIPPFETLADGT
jgi:hypothetical protein